MNLLAFSKSRFYLNSRIEVEHHFFHWIGLRENLQETMVFTIKFDGLSG